MTESTGIFQDPAVQRELAVIVERLLRERLQGIVSEQITDFVRQNEVRAKELSLIERVVRVEEELKALLEVERSRFDAIEKRFALIDKRFEMLQREMDKRFEAMNMRFETVDKRFEALQREMDRRFEALQQEMGARFLAVDKRFEAVDKRFDAMDKRFDSMDKRFTAMQWLIGTGFTVLATLMTILRLFG